MEKDIRSFINGVDCDNILISFEAFVGGFVDDAFQSFNYITEFVYKLFPQAKILLIIRKQDDLIESAYSFQVKKGYSKSINKFNNFNNTMFCDFKAPINTRLFRNSMNMDVKTLNYLIFYKTSHLSKLRIRNVGTC